MSYIQTPFGTESLMASRKGSRTPAHSVVKPGVKSTTARAHRADAASAALNELFYEAKGGERVIPYAALRSKLPDESSEIVRARVEAMAVKIMAADLGMDQSILADALRIPRSTLSRKLARRELLSSEDSAKVLGVAQLVGEAERILAESGDPQQMQDFSAVAWMGDWLRSPVGALGFRPPLDYLDNPFSQALVMQLLGRIQSGAYS